MNLVLRRRCGTLAILTLAAAALGVSAGVGSVNAAPAATPARAAVQAPPAAAASDGERWWAHVRFLADDRLEGRLTGTAGYRQAADYVAQRFKEYGLEPAGNYGYFQPVPFEQQRVVAATSTLTLVRDGKAEPVQLGDDAILTARQPQPAEVAAPLVFVGYALHIPEASFDDFAGVDCRGKIAVYINGGPGDVAGPLKSHAHAQEQLLHALAAAGAVGVINIPNPRSMDIPWERQALAASQPGMRIADPGLQDVHTPFFTATFNPARAERLFAGSGHSLDELMKLAAGGQPLPRFPLAVTLRAKVTTATERILAPNVAGILRGADPTLKAQVVVLSAHLDHLGIGEPIHGDRIYNGAMDNASGVATLLETARLMAAPGAPRPRRSLLFLAVCGEEKGLLGSRFFASHPTVARADIAADLNMDMFLPLFPLHTLIVEGLDESSLGDDARAVGSAMGVRIAADPFPDRNIFVRSDQYSFIRQGVPALTFLFAPTPGTAEEKTVADWFANRYHAPSDDVDQPVDLAAAARFDQLLIALARRIADADAAPAWKETSFFRRFAQPAH